MLFGIRWLDILDRQWRHFIAEETPRLYYWSCCRNGVCFVIWFEPHPLQCLLVVLLLPFSCSSCRERMNERLGRLSRKYLDKNLVIVLHLCTFPGFSEGGIFLTIKTDFNLGHLDISHQVLPLRPLQGVSTPAITAFRPGWIFSSQRSLHCALALDRKRAFKRETSEAVVCFRIQKDSGY